MVTINYKQPELGPIANDLVIETQGQLEQLASLEVM